MHTRAYLQHGMSYQLSISPRRTAMHCDKSFALLPRKATSIHRKICTALFDEICQQRYEASLGKEVLNLIFRRFPTVSLVK